MGKEVQSRTILNKRHGLELLRRGFKIIDIQPSVKLPGEVAFIFEDSQAFENEFLILQNENKFLKGMYGIDLLDIRILLKALQGYSIEDNERFPVMDKLQAIEDLVTNTIVKPDVQNESPEQESITDIDVNQLKSSMSGCK